MTQDEWLDEVEKNKLKLLALVAQFHPSSYRKKKDVQITAPAAEDVCEKIRNEIRRTEQDESYSPEVRFARALEARKFEVVYSMLNDTWMGVPETDQCWNFIGFPEAVSLLEDPPGNDPPEGYFE